MTSIITAGFAPCWRGRQLLKIVLLCFWLIFALATPAWPQASVGAFTTFDVPGAGTGALRGTVPYVINAAGEVAGIYLDAGFIWHGFVRTASGSITEFNVPGARQSPCVSGGPGCGTAGHLGTAPTGIDTVGDIGGVYEDTNVVYHGFVRAANGTITTFDVPAASTVANLGDQGTVPLSMNTAGVIVGTYADAKSAYHGFVRAADGTITTFDAPGAATGWRQGTVPLGVDTAGDLTGYYRDTNNAYHGFVRAANGTTTTINVPGAGTGAFQGTIGVSVNDSGIITGSYTNTSSPRSCSSQLRACCRRNDNHLRCSGGSHGHGPASRNHFRQDQYSGEHNGALRGHRWDAPRFRARCQWHDNHH